MLTTTKQTIEIDVCTPTKEEVERAIELVQSAKPCQVYWDYDDRLTDCTVKQYWKARRKDKTLSPSDWLVDDLTETNWEYFDSIREAEVRELLKDEGYSSDEIDALITDYYIASHCDLDYDIDQFNTDVHMLFELYSNFDCQESYFLAEGTYTFGDTYFGDVCRVLDLDPRAFKAAMSGDRDICIEIPEEEEEKWRDVWDKANPLVDYRKLARELEHVSCPSQLTILIDVPFFSLNSQKFTFPKGSVVGFFDSLNGSGSIFECYLLRDLEIEVINPYETTGFGWQCFPDCYFQYNIESVYGQWIGN